ncbi:hypothetical protein [Chroococcidiopsis sp. CCMEE 29]|uniref:hypothetical protein n=1 Tax=Chroococcidiopsis sp. CCMEE 29 TaxID=155894 RepID=UPI00201FD4DB|nr:hypothetical protein [Chroococcidiopsis sp. CCMEE 29]
MPRNLAAIALTNFGFASIIWSLRALPSGEAFTGNMGALAALKSKVTAGNRVQHRTFTEVILRR